MIESEDRLPDGFYTDNELYAMAVEQLESNKYSDEPTNIAIYHLLKDGKDTGLVMIVAVPSVADGQDAIDRVWADVGITAMICDYGEESPLNQFKAHALYLILQKYAYKGKTKLPGYEKVFKFQKWMPKII